LKSLVNFKGSPEYAEWLGRLAEQLGRSKAEVLEDGLKLLAKAKHLDAPPDRMGGES
jgi:hypothetical protein